MDQTYCVFGDSVTQGAYVETCWVELLRKELEGNYLDAFISVFNLGVGGDTSNDILKRFNTEIQKRQPTHIIFAFGVNDSGYLFSDNEPLVTEESFIANLVSLTSQAKKYTSEIIFIGPVLGNDALLKPYPGSSKGKSYDNKGVKKYNEMMKSFASQHDDKFVDLSFKLSIEDFSDGLHPNDQGHKKMFEEIIKYF